ncbi:uncharacterized protein LOC117591184 isoform X2 [Drosophila guanche]|uniref:uncharacterized protein LOC117591184 isoform X2 n=1 Tax=Drosophila guanche TaxID=7266 RepID=UPI0014721402|nr:uncharacterized protein LOC117591184 isoform X2 [Drosophila guanche]
MSMGTVQKTACALVVVGVPLRTGNRYSPRLTMRRVFDTKCFRTERYRHEIGNHYRDYQIQQHLHLHQKHPLARRHRSQRRRRRQWCSGGAGLGLAAEVSRMSISLAAPTYAKLRDVWPTPVQYFPRFDDTYAARGRVTICSGQPPEETYNDAVRRIKSAQHFDQLKKLVQLGSIGKRYRCNTRTRNDDEVSGEDDEDGKGNGNGNSNDNGRSSNRRSHVNYNLNIYNNQVENLQRHPHRGGVDFYTYLQLASGYYDRGLNANLKYLESIGQRNAIRHTPQLQSQFSLSSPRLVLDTVDSSWERQSAVQKLTDRLFTLLKGLQSKAASHSKKRWKGFPPDPISVHIRPLKLVAYDSNAGEAVAAS